MSERPPVFETSKSFEEPEILPFSATESLLDPARAQEMWPEEVTSDEQFEAQVQERKALVTHLEDVIRALPSPSTRLEEAVADGQLEENQATQLYDSLAHLLQDDDYKRALLYIPFEFLPNADWHPASEALQQASDRFKTAYMEAWNRLLYGHDVRANFVDGDVLEVEQRTGDLPRVVKAAHLIPKLVESGFLGIPQVVQIMDETDDEVLLASIADTIPVLEDMGLITEEQKHFIASLVEIPEIEMTEPGLVTLDQVRHALARPPEVTLQGTETERRKQWLYSTAREKTILNLAEALSPALVTQSLSRSEIAQFLAEDTTGEHGEVLLEAIGKAVETVHPEEARALLEGYTEILDTAESQAPRALAKLLRRSYSLGIVSRETLERFHIATPQLGGVVGENMQAIEPELKRVGEQVTETAETMPQLYPAALVYGSHIKGYGEAGSDIDTAVFVRPGAAETTDDSIQKTFPDATAFWLDERADTLQIHDFPDNSHGKSSWTSLLFGGAWVGQPAAVKELYDKLLTGYFYKTDQELHGRPVRKVWLEEMERDALQYRLMHKGYDRHAARRGGLRGSHTAAVDGESAFWDSGYRQLAIQLYARKVFLPKLEKK